MQEIERALNNPSAVFGRPRDVLTREGLTREQRIEVLRRWAYDEQQILVAQEENMTGSRPPVLDEILAALRELGYEADDRKGPAKSGGA